MDRKVILSIGMIVKNEEKNLEKCLNALQPIIDRIPLELIIADTGSTDKTREIAAQYTSQLYTFRWCNDFSKARNFVLEKACGEWFMFIDADEWIDNVEPLIDFMQSEKAVDFNDIGIIIKNYYTYSGSKYEVDYVKRIFRRLPGRKFQGMVHETVPEQGNIKYLDVYLHHYGYVTDNSQFGRSEKSLRNTPILLEEIKKHPNNLLALYQLAQEYAVQGDWNAMEQVCNQIINKFGKQKKEFYVIKTYWFLNRLYFLRGEYSKIIKNVEPYVADSDGCNIKVIDVIAQALDVLLKIKDYEKAKQYYKKFFNAIEECIRRGEEGETGFSASVLSLQKEELEKRKFSYSYVLYKCGNYKESFGYLKQIDGIPDENFLKENASLWHELLSITREYKEISNYYLRKKSGNSKELEYIKKIILLIWREDSILGGKIALSLNELCENDEFIDLQNLFLRDASGDSITPEEIERKLIEIPTEVDYERLLYIALKRQVSVSSFVNRCPSSKVSVIARIVAVIYPNLISEGLVSCDSAEKKSIKERLFLSKIKEYLLFDVHLTNLQLKELFNSYLDDMNSYLKYLYRTELFCEGECENLPDEHCSVVYINLAKNRIDRGDIKGGVLYYKKAVRIWPAFSPIIKILMEDLRYEIEVENKVKNQFDDYGRQIKQIINNMIASGNYNAAKEALTAYEKVNPQDEELLALKKVLGL